VVYAVIAGPVENGSLIGNGIAEHEKEADGVGGFVGAVRPEAVDSDRDSKATAKCTTNQCVKDVSKTERFDVTRSSNKQQAATATHLMGQRVNAQISVS